MLLRLATLGAIGYAAYNYYTRNREQVDGLVRKLSPDGGGEAGSPGGDAAHLAGGPLSSEAQLVHAGEGPLAPAT